MPRASKSAAPSHDPLKELEWRCIGPHRGGRVVAVAGDAKNPMVFYFGACAGGVFKTHDGGTYWENVSDGFFGTAAVGALAVSESDPNVIYAGTGETSVRGNVSHGDGVYRSTDAGKTWRNMGLADTRHIGKIRIHPEDPNLVYVAALGHAWGPNEERGLYRSRDGGEHWEKILYRGDKAGAVDLSMDRSNPRILYAAFWEVQRMPYGLSSGGAGSGLFKSTDGGDTWTEISNNPGLPKGLKGKIGVAVSPARPERVYALLEALDGALFRSDDSGATWTRLSEQSGLRQRAWYYTHLYADPQDENTCWVLNIQLWRSIDGGQTFSTLPSVHGDNHDLWIDPSNPRRIIKGDDGGACVSFNGGWSWSTLENQPTAQLYHVTTDNRDPYRIYGSQQDNSAISLPSWVIENAISESDWFVPGGGESGYIAIRPDNPDIIFGGAIGSGWGNGRLIRYDRSTGQWTNITVWPDIQGMGDSAASLRYRFQWTFPILISPHDPNVLYVAANQILRSTDEGWNWEEVSSDLTRHDQSKMQASGGPITKDNTGAEVYGTIFALVESPHEKGVFWAGSDDGLVHISRDGGKTWDRITPPDLPEWALISIIEQSPHDPATAYLAATRYKLDDHRPYLFKTHDYGKSWKSITRGIPENDFTRVIREDPTRRGVLYAGTETGIYVSLDDGGSWLRVQGNFPVVPVHDLVIKGTDLIVATHGRSFWVLDDVTILPQIAEQTATTGVQLFQPRTTLRRLTYADTWDQTAFDGVNYTFAGPLTKAYRLIQHPDGTTSEVYLDTGKNPPAGAIIHYYLPETPEGDIELICFDGDGQEIRRIKSKKNPVMPADDRVIEAASTAGEGAEGSDLPEKTEDGDEERGPFLPKRAGLNRFVWDLRHADATRIPGDKSSDFSLSGPVALPGQYKIRLTVGEQSFEQEFELIKDPRVGTEEDLMAQFELLLQVRDKLSETHQAVLQMRDLQKQIEGWEARLQSPDNERILKSARALKKKLTDIEEELIQKKAESPLNYPMKLNTKLGALTDFIGDYDGAPPQQTYDVFNQLSGRINTYLGQLEMVLKSDLPALNMQIQEASLPAIGLKEPGEKK